MATETFTHPDLFDRLKRWRAAKAKKTGQPAFWVLHNTALAEISERLPATREELGVIKGLKGKKGKSLGPEILQMVDQYRSEHHLPAPQAFQVNEDDKSAEIKTQKNKNQRRIPEIDS